MTEHNTQSPSYKRDSDLRPETISFGNASHFQGADNQNAKIKYPQMNMFKIDSESIESKSHENTTTIKLKDEELRNEYPQQQFMGPGNIKGNIPENDIVNLSGNVKGNIPPNSNHLMNTLFDSSVITTSQIKTAQNDLAIPDTKFNQGKQFHSNWLTESEVNTHYPNIKINTGNTGELNLEPIPEEGYASSVKINLQETETESDKIENWPQNPVFLKCPNCEGRICTYTKKEMKESTLRCVIIC